MKKLLVVILTVIVVGLVGTALAYNSKSSDFTKMIDDMQDDQMMMGMNQIPKDVIIKPVSSQHIPVGTQSEIILQILDKETNMPLENAKIVVGIERGGSMTTMSMMGPMFEANDLGEGKHSIAINPDKEGIYTLHVHVIPPNKTMHSMMQNHLDIGVVAE